MPELSVAELVEATGGSLLRGPADLRVSSYTQDTRKLGEAGAFFALKGTRTDGHGFLGEAARVGARLAIVELDPGPDAPAPEALIRVDNVADALTRCGEWVRRRLANVKWIAVTGSNGKTTTKEMLAEGLSAGSRVHRSLGNYNNHLGVPLSLLACPSDTQIAVMELAMSGPGEIAALTRMTDPDVGLVTNVRAVHLEFFSSLDDIAAAKGELFATLRPEATSVVNLDDMQVRVQAARHDGPRVTFGRHPAADVRLEALENQFVPGTALRFVHDGRSRSLQLKIGGAHSAFNALTAIAGVVAAGGDVDAATERISRLEAGEGRGKLHQLAGGILLVDDSYNCSPAALSSVLDTIRLSSPTGRKVMVLGDMLELGALEDAMHREAGKRMAAAGVQVLFAVGPRCRSTAEVARQKGVSEVHHYNDSTEAAGSIAEYLTPGDLVVVKGSRSVHLGLVVRTLAAELPEGS